MTDRREQILAQIHTILQGIDPGFSAFRMEFENVIESRPSAILIDGGEEFVGAKNHGGMASGQYAMRPSVQIFAQKSTGAGTELNNWRAKIIRAVLSDGTLEYLCSTNGKVRYLGCSADGRLGEAVEADMSLDFELTYLFEPLAL